MNPANQLSAALSGRYEIEREIGAGGMATVYLARDVRHSRRVALKVLKPELGAVLGVDRFLAEIRVTANLQHPNLLPLFESGEAKGMLFYVMPFVEGESLRARLDREKQLPVDEAVRIAVAIAGALDYAHQRGVIHRDLKPENVLLQAGQPVIADFGIALAVSKAGGTRVTQTGLSLGTPQYMSPEQATGDRGIDGRTDVYSLSAMTYEMLTGEPPHMGTSAQAIIAKLMTEEVRPLTTLRRAVPPHVDAAVRHGLEKLAADRFATAGEYALALTGAKPWVDSGAIQRGSDSFSATRARLDGKMVGAVFALALLAAGGIGAAVWLATRPEPRPVAARFELNLPDSVQLFEGGGTKLAITNDGRSIVVVGTKKGRKGIYLRRIGEPVAQLIRGTEGGTDRTHVSPRFSTDGEWILFQAALELKRIRMAGGQPQTVADTASMSDWGEGDRVVYVRNNELWLGTSDGRDGRRVAVPDSARGMFRFGWPRILPGGDRALIVVDRAPVSGVIVDSLRLALVSLKTGEVRDLGVAGTNPYYVASGHIVFGRSGGLVFAAPFSLRRGSITGAPRLILDGVWQGTGGATGFAVSDNGTLVYHGGGLLNSTRAVELMVVDQSGNNRRIPAQPLDAASPRISPNGRTIALSTVDGDGTVREVALVDVATGARQRLAEQPASPSVAWTPDGGRVVFLRTSGVMREIVSRAWDRSSDDVVLLRDTTRNLNEVSAGRAARFIALRGTVRGNRDIYFAPIDSPGTVRPLVATAASEISPVISPDGRWVAYTSDESGTDEVYVQPLAGPGPRLQVSVNGGAEPLWAPEGRAVLYRAPGWIVRAPFAASTMQVGKRDTLLADIYEIRTIARTWDIFPSGREFLMLRAPRFAGQSEVMVVLNWQQLPPLQIPENR